MRRLNELHVQSVRGEIPTGCLMVMTLTAAVRSQPAVPAQMTVRMRWCPPFLLVCPLSRTMVKCTPTLMARLEWVSMSVQSKQPATVGSCGLQHQEFKCIHSVWQLRVRCVEWLGYVMLFIPKPSASAVCPVLEVIPQTPKRPASLQDSRLANKS